jgi:hypothetical protein
VNDGSGMLEVSSTLTGRAAGRFVAADFDGNNQLDLAILSGDTNTVDLWQWDGMLLPAPGAFAQTLTTKSLSPPAAPREIALGNFVGSNDLAVLSNTAEVESDQVTVYTNTAGAFTVQQTLVIANLAGHLFNLGQVAGTGLDDLAVTHSNSRFITFLRNNGVGFYGVSQQETSRNPVEAVAGDVTSTANPDIVTVETEKRAVGIFDGTGGGGFIRTQIGLLTKPTFPRIVDVDGAGKADLLVLEPNADRLAVFLNRN